MTKPFIQFHDIATDQIVTREMTDEEFAQHEKDQALNAEVLVKEAERKKVFEKLGLTAEEVAALLA